MKKIKSLWSGREVEDPCILLDRGLACLKQGDIKNALEMFWQAGCTNIAIIPRLILWDEPAELGDGLDDMESWEYLNTRWPEWKDKKPFAILTLFWAHIQVRSILNLPIPKEIAEKLSKPDLDMVAEDIQGVLAGKSPKSLLAKKALEMSFRAACFIRDVEKRNIRPPMELMETLVEMDFLAKNVIQAAMSKYVDEKDVAEIFKTLNGMTLVQKKIHEEIFQTGNLMKKNSGDRSYIG